MLKYFISYQSVEQIPEKYWSFKSPVVKLEVRILKTGDVYMLDCKRCKGCGIHFKRLFRDFKESVDDFLSKKKIQPQQILTFELVNLSLDSQELYELFERIYRTLIKNYPLRVKYPVDCSLYFR